MYETRRKSAAGSVRHFLGSIPPFLRDGRRYVPVEALLWSVGLLSMATMDPHGSHLISLCPLDALGASFCPGCGLGHAVAYLARGELTASIGAHPLGLPAVLILGTHVLRLLRLHLLTQSRIHSS